MQFVFSRYEASFRWLQDRLMQTGALDRVGFDFRKPAGFYARLFNRLVNPAGMEAPQLERAFIHFPQLQGCEPHQEPLLQPLSGLDSDAVSEALDPFGVFQKFKDAVLELGRIQ